MTKSHTFDRDIRSIDDELILLLIHKDLLLQKFVSVDNLVKNIEEYIDITFNYLKSIQKLTQLNGVYVVMLMKDQ